MSVPESVNSFTFLDKKAPLMTFEANLKIVSGSHVDIPSLGLRVQIYDASADTCTIEVWDIVASSWNPIGHPKRFFYQKFTNEDNKGPSTFKFERLQNDQVDPNLQLSVGVLQYPSSENHNIATIYLSGYKPPKP